MSLELLDAYVARRPDAAPLPGGSAPFVSSSMFRIKSPARVLSAKRWDHRLSRESSRRTASTLKAASKVDDPSAIISLGTARPAPQFYPWQSLAMKAYNMASEKGDQGTNKPTVAMVCEQGENAYDLGLALNYGDAAGSPQLLRFVTEHVDIVHHPQYADWACALTCGTTSAVEIVLRMLCNEGDSIISEAYTYPGTVEAAKILNVNTVGIGMDDTGMVPTELDLVLNDWDLSKGSKPSVLYTIPTGQNPTGTTQSLERRKDIYQIAQRHDLIIVEDDPYYFLQLQELVHTNSHKNPLPLRQVGNYLDSLPSSYLSLDDSGRVLRLDATSKILAPGLRCGWITGCSQLISKFMNHTEMSTIAPSGPSQAMMFKLLDETWGQLGFFNWLNHLSQQYRQRLQTLIAVCERHLPCGICTWSTPSAGMFLWIQVDWSRHPIVRDVDRQTNEDHMSLQVEESIYSSARSHGVLISRGSWFMADRSLCRDVFFRLTFAAAASDALETAIERLGATLRTEFALTS